MTQETYFTDLDRLNRFYQEVKVILAAEYPNMRLIERAVEELEAEDAIV